MRMSSKFPVKQSAVNLNRHCLPIRKLTETNTAHNRPVIRLEVCDSCQWCSASDDCWSLTGRCCAQDLRRHKLPSPSTAQTVLQVIKLHFMCKLKIIYHDANWSFTIHNCFSSCLCLYRLQSGPKTYISSRGVSSCSSLGWPDLYLGGQEFWMTYYMIKWMVYFDTSYAMPRCKYNTGIV